MYKKMYNQVTIGGPESTLGTAVARDARFPIDGLAIAEETAEKSADEVITGRGAVKKHYVDAIKNAASLAMKLHACKAIGMGFSSLLGRDLTTPAQVVGALILTYTGAEASAKVVVDDTGQTINVTTGDLGSEAADSEFNGGSALDLTAVANDTLAELVAILDGYTGYSCEKLFGADSADITSPLAITAAQGKGRSVVIYFTGTSGVYLHRFTPVLTNTERPGYSVQFDNVGSAFDLMDGVVFDGASISSDLKGKAALTFSLLGLELTDAGSASSVALPSSHPLKFSDSAFFLNGIEFTYVRNFGAEFSNNHDADEGFGSGSLYKQLHAKGMFGVTGSLTVRTDSTSETERAKRLVDTVSSMLAKFKGPNLVTDIPEMVLVRLAAMDLMTAPKSEGGITIDTAFSYNVIDENSYDDMVTIDMLTKDAGAYNA